MASKLFLNEIPTTEETVYYWLFPHDSNWCPIIEEEKLKELVSEYLGFLHIYTKDYIWHNEPFFLSVYMDSSSDNMFGLRPHIGGRTSLGDYIEDEWFIFYLLCSLTKKFPHLICRVFDNDGEFPLIEAALHLPSWANPHTAEQRVLVREGFLHLVPPTVVPPISSSDNPARRPQIAMASVGRVAHSPSATLASPAIQSAISLRIEDYPRKISKEQHSTHAFVPVGVAALLHEYPTLVSAAARAFCYRDAIDNKCLRVMRHFPPETRVMTSVRFSKALYALLAAHPYTPDPRTGWNIPPDNNKAHVVGMKLACGFEILVCSAGGVSPSASDPGEGPDPASLDNNPLWVRYKESLKEKGYFRGEMEGSKLFRELESNARRFFLSSKMLGEKDGETDNLSIGSVVVKLYSKVNMDYETYKKREKLLSPPDDEKWLEITPEGLDEMLESKFDTKEKGKSEQEIADSLNSFLKFTSSFEGAEIPEEHEADVNRNRKPSSTVGVKKNSKKLSGLLGLQHHPQHRKVSSNSNASDCSEMSSFSSKIDFNADSFTDALNNILELSVPEDDYFNGGNDDSSGMSSYEDDDEKDLSLSGSRKTSGESIRSKASSGVDTDEKPPQRPPRRKKKSAGLGERKKKIPLASFEDFEGLDDDDDEEEEDSFAVTQLLKNYKEEGGVGPTTSLFASLGLGGGAPQN